MTLSTMASSICNCPPERGEQQNPPKCATHKHLGNTYTIVSYHIYIYTGHVSSHDQSIHILMQQDLEYKMKHNSPTHPSPIVPEKYISLEITNWGNLQKSETNIEVGFSYDHLHFSFELTRDIKKMIITRPESGVSKCMF